MIYLMILSVPAVTNTLSLYFIHTFGEESRSIFFSLKAIMAELCAFWIFDGKIII